ncbi:MAG: hypothetical protein PHY12_14045 [Eubacteriales bacterium]|nr:hypothetical protein [Eubacteriales bacterium]
MNKKFLALLLACALLAALLCGCAQVTNDRTLDDLTLATAVPQTGAASADPTADPAAEPTANPAVPTAPETTDEVVNDPNNVGYNG